MSADYDRKSKKLIGVCVCVYIYCMLSDLDGLRRTYVDLGGLNWNYNSMIIWLYNLVLYYDDMIFENMLQQHVIKHVKYDDGVLFKVVLISFTFQMYYKITHCVEAWTIGSVLTGLCACWRGILFKVGGKVSDHGCFNQNSEKVVSYDEITWMSCHRVLMTSDSVVMYYDNTVT